ncbi:MAG: hypothetical protein JW751_29130 [Polyangiaceae bacterium]|nr:hypothetical protein [Polyangiaceae bacterium]
MSRFSLLGAPIAALSTWCATAGAETTDLAAARELFHQAKEAAAAGDMAAACTKFAESYRLGPAVGTLLNLADCDQRNGRLATAWSRYQRALEELPRDDDRRPQVTAVVESLEPRLPRLTLHFPADAPDSITVTRDEAPVGKGSDGVAIPVDPGRHLVVVEAPGHRTQRYEIEVAEGEQKDILCEPGPPAPHRNADSPGAAPPPTERGEPTTGNEAPAADPRRKYRTAAYVVGGVGALALVGGGGLRVLAWAEQPKIDDHCDADQTCNGQGMDAVDRAKTFEVASTVSLIAGGAALGIGITLGFVGGRAATAGATLLPYALPGGGGLTYRRSF